MFKKMKKVLLGALLLTASVSATQVVNTISLPGLELVLKPVDTVKGAILLTVKFLNSKSETTAIITAHQVKGLGELLKNGMPKNGDALVALWEKAHIHVNLSDEQMAAMKAWMPFRERMPYLNLLPFTWQGFKNSLTNGFNYCGSEILENSFNYPVLTAIAFAGGGYVGFKAGEKITTYRKFKTRGQNITKGATTVVGASLAVVATWATVKAVESLLKA